MLAPRYGRGSSAVVAVTCSIAALIAALIGSIDRLARLRLSSCGLHQRAISSSNSSGVIKGPLAAALAWRAIMLVLDFRVTPSSVRSRAIIALRISRMAVSRNSITVSRGQKIQHEHD